MSLRIGIVPKFKADAPTEAPRGVLLKIEPKQHGVEFAFRDGEIQVSLGDWTMHLTPELARLYGKNLLGLEWVANQPPMDQKRILEIEYGNQKRRGEIYRKARDAARNTTNPAPQEKNSAPLISGADCVETTHGAEMNPAPRNTAAPARATSSRQSPLVQGADHG